MEFYGVEIASRLLLGTAQYPSPAILAEAVRAAKAEIVTIDGDARVIRGEQIAVCDTGTVHRCGESRIFLRGQVVLLPCLEGGIADKERRSRRAGERIRREVVGWPFGGTHRVYEGAFGLFVQTAGFTRFDVFAHDDEDFGRTHGPACRVLRRRDTGTDEEKTQSYGESGYFFHE